jgi:hypothetical protein
MLMRNITLPTGPYDWHETKVPRRIYDARLDALRAVMREGGLAGTILSGSTFDDGAIAWLTGFTPKLGPAYALVPLAGQPRLLFSGGPGMRPSAQRLTWLEDVAALKSLTSDLSAWDCPKPWGLVEDAGLSAVAMHAIGHVHGGHVHGGMPTDLTAAMDRLRRVPEAAVKPLIHRGAEILGLIETSLIETAAPTRWEARLAAEQLAFDLGAQDLRLRLSAIEGGRPEPVDPDGAALPEQAALTIALRADGYWLLGHGWRGPRRPRPDTAGLARLAAGVAPATLGLGHIAPLGHSLVEPPLDPQQPLAEGQCLRVTLDSPTAPLSVLVEITAPPLPSGPRLLWAAAALAPQQSGLTGVRP